MTSSKTYLQKSIVDETFNKDSLNHYHLYIQLGNGFLLTSVLDKTRKKFIALEDFRFPLANNVEELVLNYELAKQESCFLALENFQKVNCCVCFQKATLVPDQLYDKQHEKLLINFVFQDTNNETLFTDDIKRIGVKNVFAISTVLEKMLRYWYKDITIHHHSTSFINSVLIENKNKTSKAAEVNIRAGEFDIAVTEGGKLIFYNSFNFKTGEDFLYYILFVFEQLQLNPEIIPVTLIGEADKYSPYYSDLRRYIRNVNLGMRPAAFDFIYKFDTLPEASYAVLFNQYLCES